MNLIKYHIPCQEELYSLNLYSWRISTMKLFGTNFKATDNIGMVRSGGIAEKLWLNMAEGYDHKMWAEETPRDSKSIKTVKSRDSDVQQLTILL